MPLSTIDSDPSLFQRHQPPPPGAVDLAERLDPAASSELMDEPCSYEEFRDCVRDLAACSRLTLAYRPTLRFIADAHARHRERRPLRILDVGSGGGDTLRRIALWAQRNGVPVELIGIDLNPHATRAASDFSARDPRSRAIRWITGDLFSEPQAQAPDLVLSSLVTHHMRDEEIVRFLRWMEAKARLGWFVSDLVRSPRSYRLFRVLSRLMGWHAFVQNDGLVSIRRGFREPDWLRLLHAAAIPHSFYKLQRCSPGRLCLARAR